MPRSRWFVLGALTAFTALQALVPVRRGGAHRKPAHAHHGRIDQRLGTPTVVHFGGTVLVSAIMSAPWPSLVPPSVALALCRVGGLGYGAIVIHRTRRQTMYSPGMRETE